MFQYSLTNLGGVNAPHHYHHGLDLLFQYSLTNLGGVNYLVDLRLALIVGVSVFSNESWWGELLI